jgi:hypothetical protein
MKFLGIDLNKLNKKRRLIMKCASISLVISLFVIAVFVLNTAAENEQTPTQSTRNVVRVAKIQNDTASFTVIVDVDKPTRIYEEGEPIKIKIKSDSDGYLYLFLINAEQKLILLYPDPSQNEGPVKIEAKKEVTYPLPNVSWEWRISEPFGEETIIAVVSKKPLFDSKSSEFDKAGSIRTIEEILEERKKEINAQINAHKGMQRFENDYYAIHTVQYTCVAKGTDVAAMSKQNRYAVIISVSEYKDRLIKRLPGCKNDAEGMKRLFKDTMGVPEENFFVFSDEKATKANIERLFKEILPEKVKNNDILFIYWTGHGDKMANIDKSNNSFEHYLLPYDADPKNSEKTMICETPFGHWLNLLNGTTILTIIDACHSAGMANNAKGAGGNDDFDFGMRFIANPNSKALGQKNMAIILSSDTNEKSWVENSWFGFTTGIKLSIMTKHLIKAVRDNNKVVTHRDIVPAIKDKVNEEAKKQHGYNQTIKQQDEIEGDGLLLKPKAITRN